MLIGNMANFLDGTSAAGIHAEDPSVLDDLGHGKLAPALVHIEDSDTQEPFVGSRFRVCEAKPKTARRALKLVKINITGMISARRGSPSTSAARGQGVRHRAGTRNRSNITANSGCFDRANPSAIAIHRR